MMQLICLSELNFNLFQFMEVVNKVDSQCSLSELFEIFNDQGFSDYIVVYLR